LIAAALLAFASLAAANEASRVAVLLVDTDYIEADVDPNIYGHFLEHINHSVVDGLYAEQVQGQGFEGRDFRRYWRPISEENSSGSAEVVEVPSVSGDQSVRIQLISGTVGIRQNRVNIEEDIRYDGSLWLKAERGAPEMLLRVRELSGDLLAEVALGEVTPDWQEAPYAFTPTGTDKNASIDIVARGSGAVLVDHISLMPAAVRRSGMLRPDLLKSLGDLNPPFIRWPGGSFASFYDWRDGIGPRTSRTYRPNVLWGNYSDYNGFGTHEFLEFCRQIGTEPLICLSAASTDPNELKNALDWVHYVNDPPTTELGKLRAANGHPEPYNVRYFQIDNEPMNHGHSAADYAAIVNLYGAAIRKIEPKVTIVACGQKRSNDMNWSYTLIDTAGDNFDILGCHNYEYEPDRYALGVKRIEDYLVKLTDYVRRSDHPDIKVGVLEWSLCRTYDWRAGLHAAGSLMAYERLSPELAMTCPALLMRNTTDDPTWTAFIYHDHVSWFPGGGYIVEKLFRDHYAEQRVASNKGTFVDIPRRSEFFDDLPQMKPEQWLPDTVDSIATRSADGSRIVVKAVNYNDESPTLLVRLQGADIPEQAQATLYSVSADLDAQCSIESPDAISVVEETIPYSRDMEIPMKPYSVILLEITAQ
jgi:alpha-N-arabinofuranosidase